MSAFIGWTLTKGGFDVVTHYWYEDSTINVAYASCGRIVPLSDVETDAKVSLPRCKNCERIRRHS